MPDTRKYANPSNIGRQDVNKHGWKLGDTVHVSGGYVIANRYNYCGYDEIEVPRLAKAKIIGIKQTTLNAEVMGGIGDVYVDVVMVDLKNFDGTPVILGNRIAGTFCEANPNHMVCPDGSGDLGMVMDGKWLSYEGVWGETNRFGQQEFTRNKVIDLEEVA